MSQDSKQTNPGDAKNSNATRQFATFYVDGDYFGVDVLRVQEILRHQEMSPVPLAPPVIAGLINLRGQIVTGFDLRQRLCAEKGRRQSLEESKAMNIVVKTEDGAVSFLVDDIGDVLTLETSTFEAPPETLPANLRPMLECICKLEGRLLLILDSDKALDYAPAA